MVLVTEVSHDGRYYVGHTKYYEQVRKRERGIEGGREKREREGEGKRRGREEPYLGK